MCWYKPFIKQWSNRTVHINTKDQPVTPSDSIHISSRSDSNCIFHFFVSFSALHFLYRRAGVWVCVPWGFGGVQNETVVQRWVRTLGVLVTQGRRSIPRLWGFPAAENQSPSAANGAELSWSRLRDRLLTAAGWEQSQAKGGEVRILHLLIFFSGMMLWSKLVSFESNFQTVTHDVCTRSGVHWWIIKERQTFQTLFVSGLVLFGSAEPLFLGHISIFT